jgi:hypothetical protein
VALEALLTHVSGDALPQLNIKNRLVVEDKGAKTFAAPSCSSGNYDRGG